MMHHLGTFLARIEHKLVQLFEVLEVLVSKDIDDKTVAEWVPLRERALASGLFDTGGAVGAAIVYPIVAGIIALSGWRTLFLVCGVVGIIWALLWIWLYRRPQQHPRIGKAELDMLNVDQARNHPGEAAYSLWAMLSSGKVWGLILAFLTRGFSQSFFMTWLPTFLATVYGFTLLQTGTLAAIPIVCGVVGNLLGGFFTDWLVKIGKSLGFSRKLTITLGVLSAMTMAPAAFIDNGYFALAMLAFANFGTQFASGAMWALPADLAPNEASVGRLAGIQNCALWAGSFISPMFVGFVVDAAGGNFTIPLIVGGLMGIVTIFAITVLVGKVAPIKLNDRFKVSE